MQAIHQNFYRSIITARIIATHIIELRAPSSQLGTFEMGANGTETAMKVEKRIIQLEVPGILTKQIPDLKISGIRVL